MMPSFNAFRLPGRLRPMDSTGPVVSMLSSPECSEVAVEAFPIG